ncbi:MAG TPA: hypothetical protein VGF21_02360 [Thermoleophilaceae bacterium]|jgi:hypothetical protein
MRWFLHTISILLVLAAAGITLAIAFSSHSDDYGRVPLPQGGTVHLPKGKVTIYYRVRGEENPKNASGLALRITPVGGGAPIATLLANGQTSDVAVTRSETIGEAGSLAKLDVPAAGDYVVSATTPLAPGVSSLEFGTNAGAAVLKHWKLLGGLLVGALLLALIPAPRSGRRRRGGDEPTGWSSNPRAPYAG